MRFAPAGLGDARALQVLEEAPQARPQRVQRPGSLRPPVRPPQRLRRSEEARDVFGLDLRDVVGQVLSLEPRPEPAHVPLVLRHRVR
jgi:hypothetical protein